MLFDFQSHTITVANQFSLISTVFVPYPSIWTSWRPFIFFPIKAVVKETHYWFFSEFSFLFISISKTLDFHNIYFILKKRISIYWRNKTFEISIGKLNRGNPIFYGEFFWKRNVKFYLVFRFFSIIAFRTGSGTRCEISSS